MPTDTYFKLAIFQEFIENDSVNQLDVQNAFSRLMASQNPKAKLSDFTLIKGEQVFKTEEEIAEIERKRNHKRQESILSMVSPEDRKKLLNKGK